MRWGPPARSVIKELLPRDCVQRVYLDPTTLAPGAGRDGGGGSWASPAPLSPRNSQCRKASLSTLQLYSQTRCLREAGGRAWGSAGWGRLSLFPWSHPLREGAADHRDASAPGNPTLPKKGLFIPKNLMGEVITG